VVRAAGDQGEWEAFVREVDVSKDRLATTLNDRLLALIALNGPITIAQYMTSALYDPQGGYYTQNARVGGDGDFLTAPETGQMFGELIGLWCAQEWMTMGSPPAFNLVELGPGNGMLITDAWRATRIVPGFHDAARISLVEVSPALRERQADALDEAGARATWIGHLDEAPDLPTLIVGNEYLDCLPIRQFVRVDGKWRERLIGAKDGALAFGLAPDVLVNDSIIPAELRDAKDGAIAEVSPVTPAFVASLADRFAQGPGRALLIDYGAIAITGGDTLQAMHNHELVDPLLLPGAVDLTAHVDFVELARTAHSAGLGVAGPFPQGPWLEGLGVRERAAALTKARPDKAGPIERQLMRLTSPNQMGVLFNVICLSSRDLPPPAGFPPSPSPRTA